MGALSLGRGFNSRKNPRTRLIFLLTGLIIAPLGNTSLGNLAALDLALRRRNITGAGSLATRRHLRVPSGARKDAQRWDRVPAVRRFPVAPPAPPRRRRRPVASRTAVGFRACNTPVLTLETTGRSPPRRLRSTVAFSRAPGASLGGNRDRSRE